MGSKMDAVAVFEATSVMTDASRHIRNMMTVGGSAAKAERWLPIEYESPDTLKASEMA